MEENISQNPQIEPVVEIPVQAPKAWLKIILFSVLGLILAGGLVYAGMQIGKSSPLRQGFAGQAKLTPTQPPVATPALTFPPETNPLPVETANWRTYKNDAYGYEFKYPHTWLLELIKERFGAEEISIPTVKSPNSKMVDFAPANTLESGAQFSIAIYPELRGLSLNEIANPQKSLPALVTNRELIWFKNIQAVSYDFKGDGSPSVVVSFLKSNALWSLSMLYTERERATAKEFFNLILSTFRFLD